MADSRGKLKQNVSFEVSFEVPFVHRLRFTSDLFHEENHVLLELLEPSGDGLPRVQFWVDENVAHQLPDLCALVESFCRCHADRIAWVGDVQRVPGGELIKNDIRLLESMLKVIHAADLDRHSYVIVIGGGAVLDAVGFAAAIAHRGIRLVRLPTTTLAQADSGIGVKNSVNLFQTKNWIGTFAVPWGVINDSALLKSLSHRDFICGFSEAVKVSLLKSAEMFAQLERSAEAIGRREPAAANAMIRWSAQLHLEHITRSGDPFEALEARPLDFGHWSAHRLEAMSDFELRHGEAVAIGVAIDTVYSSLVHELSVSAADRVLQCLQRLGFELFHPALEDTHTIFAGLEEFRQHLGGRLTLTMLNDIGQPLDVHHVDRKQMETAIARVVKFASSPRDASGSPHG